MNLNSFSNVIVRNKGVLGIRSDTTVDLGTVNLTTYGTSSSYVSVHGDGNVTYPPSWTISGYTLFANTITAGKLVNVTVATNGVVSHFMNVNPAMYGLNITLSGNLTVNGVVNADTLGYPGRTGPGAVSQVTYGAAHGGWAGSGNRELTPGIWYNNKSYGSILAPTLAGSGGASDGTTYSGGGVIALTVAGTTTVAATTGFITANGGTGVHGGSSGGSIRLTTGRLEGAGTIRANGGTAGMGAGAGGRIAIILTGAGEDFSSWTGANTAYGGASSYPAAAGTVYRQAKADLAGAGTVLADNAGRAINVTLTPIPAFAASTEDLLNTVWVAENTTRLGLVANTAVESLTLSANSRLELSGRTLNLRALTIDGITYRSGVYTPTEIPQYTDAVGGGQVILLTRQAGTMFSIR